jgi:putative DNA methylase
LLSETPEQLLFKGALGFRVPAYGVLSWGDFFRPRQIASLTTFSQLIVETQKKAFEESIGSKRDAEGYAKAIAAYLTCALGRAVDYWTINTMWEPGGEFIIHTFSEMTIPIVWDSAEGNPFAPGGGGWNKTCLDWVIRVIQELPKAVGPGSIVNIRAQDIEPPDNAIFSTDPPYFDNIGYADLSDAFYVWERKPLASIFPELSRRLSTPKDGELVATAARHGGTIKARDFFLEGMKSVFARMHSSNSTDPISIYYSFKEKGRIGSGSGWEAFLEAIVGPGWQIDASWPLKTERPTRNRSIGKAALASAVVLVCRKRPENAEVCTRSDFIRTLKRELPSAVEYIRRAGVSPVDIQQCIIGPGIGVFSRYSRVLEDDDSRMSVKNALILVNRIWNEIENELDADFDSETQVALSWYASYGFDAKPSGELITQANAKSLPISALFASGLFKDMKGKVALTPRESLPRDWSPTKDKSLTIWECVQHTARALNADDGGSQAAAKLVAGMGVKSTDARALAYRLYEVASHKSWAAEALIYNELAQEWTQLEDIAGKYGVFGKSSPKILDLFGEAAL